jgi:hypothetical protein
MSTVKAQMLTDQPNPVNSETQLFLAKNSQPTLAWNSSVNQSTNPNAPAVCKSHSLLGLRLFR